VRLADKVAIVTGGARGIGLAVARRFLREGARVTIADVDRSAGDAAQRALGPGCLFVAADVGDAREAARLVTETLNAFGNLDILVNNAGIVHSADFLDIAETDFDRVLRVNLKGAFLVGQAAARQMVAQVKSGRSPGAIVNMSSINAVVAIPNQVPYCVAKGGLAQLTRVMALSLAPHGIRVNAIGPGSIMTDILKAVANDRQAMEKILMRTPLGRIADPDEIAAVAVFLVSSEASYISGQTVYADGGRLALNYTVALPQAPASDD
jgi:glucose 1-dehydrogenase